VFARLDPALHLHDRTILEYQTPTSDNHSNYNLTRLLVG